MSDRETFLRALVDLVDSGALDPARDDHERACRWSSCTRCQDAAKRRRDARRTARVLAHLYRGDLPC